MEAFQAVLQTRTLNQLQKLEDKLKRYLKTFFKTLKLY
jgi:hypothetical protein